MSFGAFRVSQRAGDFFWSDLVGSSRIYPELVGPRPGPVPAGYAVHRFSRARLDGCRADEPSHGEP